MFLRNCWYVAAWDNEVGREPFARLLLNEPVVMFRTEDGTPVALADRCCHRALPLSMGKLVGDRLQCGYHGLEFDASGACVGVPGQSTVPPGAQVRAYPLVERWQWLWIWMGDPALADESQIPDWWWMDHPDWRVVKGNGGKPLPTACDYELVTDNLLDLTHLTFVHTDTIGNDEITRFPCKTERQANGVRMERMMHDVDPAPFYKMAGKFPGNVDRWQVVDTILPAHTDVDVGCAEIGSGVLDGDRNQGIAFHALNSATPETETTCHFFYAHPRLFATDSDEMDEVYRRDFYKVFMEDVVIMEAQQKNRDREPARGFIDINVDSPALTVRRMLRDRIADEQSRQTRKSA